MPVFRLFLILFLSLPGLLAGQHLQFSARNFEFNNEPLKIRKLYQAQNGFMFLGTAQGLFQYDGVQTKPIFTNAGAKHLQSVTAIFQDSQKRLWIGCETGKLYTFTNQKATPFLPGEGTPKVSILAIQEDLQGNIWFATYGEGLYCWKKNRLYNFNTDDGLPDNFAYALALDNKGNIWAGTDRGIGICNFSGSRKQVQKIGQEQGLPDNIVTALAICPGKKTIWIGTYSGSFCTIDVESRKITLPVAPTSQQIGIVTKVMPTGATTCLIATQGHGLWEFDTTSPTRLISLTNPSTFPGLKISDVWQDKEGLIWLANNSDELYVANSALRFLQTGSGSLPAGIHALCAAQNGNIWFSTDAGIFSGKRQEKGFEIKPVFSQLPFRKFKVVSLFEDARGFLWAGTFGGGVFRLEPESGKVINFTEKNGLVNDNVLSITGSGNDIWLATLGGASHYRISGKQDGTLPFDNFSQLEGIGFNYIYQVFADHKKRIWFATDGKGLTKFENGRFSNFSEKEGLTSKTIYSITETKDGKIWVSTPKSGLFKLEGNRFVQFKPEGLRDLNISTLTTDKFGNLLIVHKTGLDVLNTLTGQIRYYGQESKLETGELDLNSFAKDTAGTVWFSTQKGLAAYAPVSGEIISQPQIRLSGMQLFLKPIPFRLNQTFRHDENHITFEYAGLWFQNAEEVNYCLKLEGYDREWTVSNNRSITYPKLPPGKYTFKVSASATGKFRNSQPASYSFEIEKPFWNTFWFYGLVLTAGAGILFGVIKSREKRLKKAERQEKDKVMFQFETLKNQVNPHFLFNSFNTLIGIIEDDQEAAVAYVEKLSDFFRDILVYREKDTITLREELILIQNYYFLQQKRYGSNLKMQVNVSESEQDLLIAPLTLQLLVENAIKHNIVSRDKPLTVEIFTENGNCLVVRNNLQKKKQPETSTGIGLANIKNRYAILSKRTVQVTQNATVFEVKIPLFSSPTP